MAIDFPDSPVNGDTFDASGKKWLYNGNVWVLQGVVSQIADGSISTTQLASNAVHSTNIAAGAVTAAKLGQDISLTPADGSITQAKLHSTLSGITICTSSTKPGSPFVGQTIFETDTNTQKVWLGSAWSNGTGHATTFTATYLVVAGGGGAGSDMGGGGGGGGYLEGTTSLASGTYSVTIGGGGTGGPAGHSQVRGTNGVNTIFSNLQTVGGGGGGSGYDTANNAALGGSGGGAQGNSQPGAAGTPGQGFAGASGGGNYFPGGGGGGGSVGGYKNPGASFVRAMGGFGVANAILGTSYYWAGGGGGSGYSTYAGDGGFGGGGGGAPKVDNIGRGDLNGYQPAVDGTVGSLNSQTNVPGGAGGVNTGGGGGGGAHYNANNPGGNGGSGIVVIRYLTTDSQGFTNITGGTKLVDGIYTIHRFTTSGSLVLT